MIFGCWYISKIFLAPNAFDPKFIPTYVFSLWKSYSNGLYMRWKRISCRSFWIQNGLWAIFGWWVINKTVLGVFWKNGNSEFFWKHPKLFCLYLSNQITLRGRFVFKTNGRITSFTSYKDHCCSLFTSWEIKQSKSYILEILNFSITPNIVLLISQEPNIAKGPFCIQN